jgi:hypothetical protein
MEGVHLLGNNIGLFADGAAEQLGLFKNGNTYFLETESLKDVPDMMFQEMPNFDFPRQDIVHSLNARDFQFILLFKKTSNPSSGFGCLNAAGKNCRKK